MIGPAPETIPLRGILSGKQMNHHIARRISAAAGLLLVAAPAAVVDVGTSAYGLTRPVLKADSWSLFRTISSDYQPAYKTMTGFGLSVEAAGQAANAYNLEQGAKQ